MNASLVGAYTANDELVDYILGITYEIWEERKIELIRQYYSPETIVYCLDGIVHGADEMVDGTEAMLRVFPDRLLLGDDVIGSGDCHSGYSSHRVLSPMTNNGASIFGASTGNKVRITNMADCAIDEGVIVKEWLARDNLALILQLGFDVRASANVVAEKFTGELRSWFESETNRLQEGAVVDQTSRDSDLQSLLRAQWITGDDKVLNTVYPHYAVLHRSPIELLSGQHAIVEHYAALRTAFTIENVSVDHVCRNSLGGNIEFVATRWSICGRHEGEFLGLTATQKPIFVMGVTHQKYVNGRVAAEWTVFDSLAVLAQLL